MPSGCPVRVVQAALAGALLCGCVTVVKSPPPETVSLRVADGQPRRVAVLVQQTDVRLLSLLGAHDTHAGRSSGAARSWAAAVADLRTSKPSFKAVDVEQWDAATRQDWVVARAQLDRWLTALFEERLAPYHRSFVEAGKAPRSPEPYTSQALDAGGVILRAELPVLGPAAHGDFSLDLDWNRWRRQLDADELLILYSTDTRVTPDRFVAGIAGGTAAGAVAGFGYAFSCAGGGGGGLASLFMVVACGMFTVPAGALNGAVVLPERLAGEHRFAAALVDITDGNLVFVARSIVDKDSDDSDANRRLLLELIP